MKLIFNRSNLMQLLEFVALSFVVFTTVFILIHIIPGQTAKLANASLPIEQQRAIIEQYGLDQPLATQFFLYVQGIFTRLEFGFSIAVRIDDSVTNILNDKIALSMGMGAISIVLSFVFGYTIGVFVGVNQKNIFGTLSNTLISLIMTIPAFLLGTLIVMMANFTRNSSLILFDFLRPETWILPIITLIIPNTMIFANYVSNQISANIQQQYVKFVYAKGLSPFFLYTRHLFKPAIFSSITLLPSMLLGTVIAGLFVDGIFSIPGIGSVLSSAISSKDYDIVQTLVLLFSFLTIVAFWLRDLLYRITDPRVR